MLDVKQLLSEPGDLPWRSVHSHLNRYLRSYLDVRIKSNTVKLDCLLLSCYLRCVI